MTDEEDYGGPLKGYLAACNPTPSRHNVHMDEAITPSQKTKENQMLDFIKSVLLVNKVKKATATRFVTAYSKHGRINGIIVKRGIIKSVIRVPKRGDVTVYNTNIGFIRHDKVTSFK